MPVKRKPPSPHAEAERHLARAHPGLREIIRRTGACTMQAHPDYFGGLVRIIVSQQLAARAADSIIARFEQALAPEGFTPARIAAATDETIRACGLSGGKLRAVRDLCARVGDGTLALDALADESDDELRARLTQVHGIGPWSVDMFLMFALGRPDVLPVGDLGVRVGFKKLFALTDLPRPQQMIELAEPWRPYRSIASWYFWKDPGPQC